MRTWESAPLYYEMKIQGQLDASRLGWFEGLEIRHDGDTTTVKGVVEDPAALYGVIGRARDLGLVLISIVSEPCCSGSSRPGTTPICDR